ncbi:MAG: STAS domain-containing protein [Anaerolineae bacterium]|nr:STAS domain-containing protein [Anaerolineae bacterium]
MLLRFWGTRGTIPAPIRPDQVEGKIMAALSEAGQQQINLTDPQAVQKLARELSKTFKSSTVGGNTTCVTVRLEDDLIIFDAGSGIRELGDYLMESQDESVVRLGFRQGKGHAYMFFTHTHWDHVQGFPFFKPIHVVGNVFDIYHIHDHVPDALARQMHQHFCPIRFDRLGATLNYHQLEEGEQVNIAGASITNIQLNHPGRAYAYRVVADNAIAILATDSEYKSLDYVSTAKYINFYANADMLIFDAMFSVRESFVKEDWGHSSALIGADIAREANVKQLYLFHHDPATSDDEIMQILKQTREYLGEGDNLPEVLVAMEGLEVDLTNPNMTDFYIQEHVDHDVIFMTLSGKLGAHATEQFRQHLAQSLQAHQTDKVVLRLENLSDLTMAGIRALVDARKSVLSLALVGIPENVYRVIELTGTTDFFAIYDTVEEALLALNMHQR